MSSSSSGGSSGDGGGSSSSSSNSCCNPECIFLSLYTSPAIEYIRFLRQPDCTYLSEDETYVVVYNEMVEIWEVNLVIDNSSVYNQDVGGDICDPLGGYNGDSIRMFECCPVDITTLYVFIPDALTTDGDKNVVLIGNLYDTLFTGTYEDTVNGTIVVELEYDFINGWGVNIGGFVFAGEPTSIMDRCNPEGLYQDGITVSLTPP